DAAIRMMNTQPQESFSRDILSSKELARMDKRSSVRRTAASSVWLGNFGRLYEAERNGRKVTINRTPFGRSGAAESDLGICHARPRNEDITTSEQKLLFH